jgi:hypothetical protein
MASKIWCTNLPSTADRASADGFGYWRSSRRVVAVVADIDLVRVARWCEHRVPQRARHQVRMEYRVRGATVTVVERRVPWDAPGTEFGPAWTTRPVAQLRRTPPGWRLFWPDRRTRWHLIDDVPASPSVIPLLEALDDPRRALLG